MYEKKKPGLLTRLDDWVFYHQGRAMVITAIMLLIGIVVTIINVLLKR